MKRRSQNRLAILLALVMLMSLGGAWAAETPDANDGSAVPAAEATADATAEEGAEPAAEAEAATEAPAAEAEAAAEGAEADDEAAAEQPVPETPKEEGEPLELTVIHFNDSHGREGESKVDLARIAGKVNEMRNDGENVLLLDAGDTLHGRPIANLFSGYSVTQIRNSMGVDAAVPGNHDFNYGSKRLVQLAGYTDYPWLAANLVDQSGAKLLDTNVIKTFDGYKVGIFGLATPETVYKSHPDNVAGLTFKDPLATAQAYAKKLKEAGCDYIIALGHIGLDGSTEITSADICDAVPEIDLFVDGHSHTQLENGLPTKNGIVVQTGEYLNNVGYVRITVSPEGDKRTRVSLMNEADTATWPIKTQTRSYITWYENAVSELTQEVIGTTEVELIGDREVVRRGDSNLGNLIVDAIRASTGADIALNNGGNVRTTIPVGNVTYGQLLEVMPFGNIIVTKDVKGADVLAALEQGVSFYPDTTGGFLHISGGTYVFDPDKPAGERIVECYINGELIDPERVYVVATNDFLAAGGDESPLGNGSVKAQTDPMDEAVLDYIKEHGIVIGEIEVSRVLKLGEVAG